MKDCDVLIVGAGFAGLVLAERLSNGLGKTCLVIDKRDHIGGNAYDYVDKAGVLIHKYGSHCFHTNSDRVFSYLSRFTEWIPAAYYAKSFTEGKFWSFPINLQTYEQMVGHPSTPEDMEAYLAERRVPIAHPKNSEEAVISQVGWELYEMFYKGYVQKHWHRHPRQLDASVCSRVPFRTERNDLYFNDKHQCMPLHGYHAMFSRLLATSPRVRVQLNTNYGDVRKEIKPQWTIYSGPIDEYFNYSHGVLPYRSVRFETQSFGPRDLNKGYWQPAFMVAYPNSEAFTRIVEIKHVTGQICDNSTIVRDYPEDYVVGKDAHYPVPAPDSALIYAKYKRMAEEDKNVSFVGRLATYKYYNMDQVVGMALAEFERLRKVL